MYIFFTHIFVCIKTFMYLNIDIPIYTDTQVHHTVSAFTAAELH